MQITGNLHLYKYNNTISCGAPFFKPYLYVQPELMGKLLADPTTPVDLACGLRDSLTRLDTLVPGDRDGKFLLFCVGSHERQRLSPRECVDAEVVMANNHRNAAIAIVRKGSTVTFRHRQFVERYMHDGEKVTQRLVEENVL